MLLTKRGGEQRKVVKTVNKMGHVTYLTIDEPGIRFTRFVMRFDFVVALVLKLVQCCADVRGCETFHFVQAVRKSYGVLHCCHRTQACIAVTAPKPALLSPHPSLHLVEAYGKLRIKCM